MKSCPIEFAGEPVYIEPPDAIGSQDTPVAAIHVHGGTLLTEPSPLITKHQLNALVLGTLGLSHEESACLHLRAASTIKRHRKDAFAALGASSMSAAVGAALEAGIFIIPEQGQMSPVGQISRREFEVIGSLARSGTYRQAADELGVSPHTVKSHLARITQRTTLHKLPQITLAYHMDGYTVYGA